MQLVYFPPTVKTKEELHLMHPEAADISYRFCGHHICSSGYAYGPTVRDEFIIHFVDHGAGYYRIDNKSYRVERGSSFALFPGYILHYQADKADPWEYYWIAFEGQAARAALSSWGLNPTHPIVTHQNPAIVRGLFQDILTTSSLHNAASDFDTLASFYKILSCISQDCLAKKNVSDGAGVATNFDEHIRDAITFIQENYFDHDLTVEVIAKHVFLERSYFSTVFKNNVGIPPNHFLIKVRLENACRMLTEASVSIKRVAYSVGYKEQGYFDKVFRKYVGQSPSEYRGAVQNRNKGTDADSSIPEQLDRSFFS